MGMKNLAAASFEHTIEHSTGVTEILTKSVAVDGSEEASSENDAGEPVEQTSSLADDSDRMTERIAWTKCG